MQNSCGEFYLRFENRLSLEAIERLLQIDKLNFNVDEILKWRAINDSIWMGRPPLSLPPPLVGLYQLSDQMTEFGFGVICGMIDGVLDQITGLISLTEGIIAIGRTIAGAWLAGSAQVRGFLIDTIRLLLFSDLEKRKYELLGIRTDHVEESLQALAQHQYDEAKKIWENLTVIKQFISFFKTLTPEAVIQFIASELQAIIDWVGGILSDARARGYAAGKLLIDMVISWATAGVATTATAGLKAARQTLTQVLVDFTGAGTMNGGFIRKIKAIADDRSLDLSHSGFDTQKRNQRCAAQLGCFAAGTLLLTAAGPQAIEAQIPVFEPARVTASASDLPGTSARAPELAVLALNATHTLPSDVQDIDLEEITPATWRWLHLSYIKPDSSTAQIYLRRPLWWMQQHGARATGDLIPLLMPEMGIVGRARLEAIFPNTLDTRSWDYRAQGDYAHYPITGFFAHESAEVWDLYFSSGPQPVSATYNHPFYSADRAQYVFAGELALGERILTHSDDTVQFLLKRPHAGLSTRVYNLEVWRAHNFLVTEKGMVVHNNGCMALAMGSDPLLCLMETLKKRLKNPNLEAQLEKDLLDKAELRDALTREPGLIESWELLSTYSILRTIPANLESLNKWLKEGIDFQKLTDGISKSSSKQNLINQLGVAKSRLHALVLIKDYENIPGVAKGRYTPNGSSLSDKVDLPNGWANDVDLPENQIRNFTGKIEPLELKPGDKIYRVSNANGASGPYWTRTKPEKLDDVVGGTAVLPEWNNFQFLHEYTIPDGVTIKTWKGKTASQPVSYRPDGTPLPSNYHLPGGNEQLFISFIGRQDPNFESTVKSAEVLW